MNHMQSMKFENKLYASVKQKMEEMQQHNMSWIEVENVNNQLPLMSQNIINIYIYISICMLGAIPEEGCRYTLPMSPDFNVHIRLCVLLEKEQSIHDI